MRKTERINLLVSPTEKSDIESRVKPAGISISELVRQALARHDATEEFEALADISHELAAVTRMHENLDTALTRLNELDAQAANREGIAAEIRQELIASG